MGKTALNGGKRRKKIERVGVSSKKEENKR